MTRWDELTPPRRRRVVHSGIRLLLLLGGLAAGTGLRPAHPAVLPDGYLDQRIVAGLDNPTSFAFLPDGRVLIAERAGGVRLLTASFLDTATVLREADVRVSGEGGFGAIAIDPDWPRRPYLYAFTTRATAPAIALLRYRAVGALADPAGLDLAFTDRYTILDGLPDAGAAHNGSDLQFAPEGTLLMSLGDDGVRCAAQDSTSARGAILRLDLGALPDSLTDPGPPDWRLLVPPDNPHAADSTRAALVFCHGLRNPFRFHVDAPTGHLMIGDVGGSLFEEIDEAAGGENFGWPLWEADSARADLCGFAVRPPRRGPVFAYPHGVGSGFTAVTGGPVYHRQGGALQFDPTCEGDYFCADVYLGGVQRLHRQPGGGWALADSAAGQPDAAHWATGLPGITQMKVGPDGGLYLTRLFDGDFRRIIHATDSGVGEAADAAREFDASPNPARVGHLVTFRRPGGATGRLRLVLHDVAGRLVFSREWPAEQRELAWDGRGRAGRPVAAGVYFARLEGTRGEGVRRLVLR